MKTKIVYISGGEYFSPAEVRGAFDEIRQMLQLDSDTVLFGLPVDEPAQVIDVATVEGPVEVPETLQEAIVIEEPKAKRVRKKKEAVLESEPEAEAITTEPVAEVERAIPILSVLGGGMSAAAPVVDEPVETVVQTVIRAETSFIDTPVDIDDEPAPTIEDIFAELEPLKDDAMMIADESDERVIAAELESDATLNQMAAEFVATESELVSAPAPKAGKIGKLKNILSFKPKSKEPGVLGDLFGWAGIAANDEEGFDGTDFFATGRG